MSARGQQPRWIRPAIEGLVVAAVCLWLSPLDTRTVFAAASGYVRTTTFGQYDRMVFSHLNQRPFEFCQGVDALHSQALDRVEAAIPGIEASSRFEPVRLVRLLRVFHRETQAFYSSECPTSWTYSHYYAEYQGTLIMVAPIIWWVDVLNGDEAILVVLLIVVSWLGIASLFFVSKRLTQSSTAGFASLAVLWLIFSGLGPTWFGPVSVGRHLQYVDFRLNLYCTLALVGAAQFLCDLPLVAGRLRLRALEISVACAFAAVALLLLFVRLAPTKLDAIAIIGSVVAVAAIRRDRVVLWRAVLLFVMVTLVQFPYQRFSARLLGPVSAVNTAASDEFKYANVAQYVNERPSHFGNFILDYNNTWMHDGDYYLRRLSSVAAFHHGYPAWGKRFLTETLVEHPTELPNAWWKRFVVQVVYHEELSYGLYEGFVTAGAAGFRLAIAMGFVILLGGRRWSSAWPLMGLLFWELFGLHTFLALMHVHRVYLIKSIPLLWCAMPCLTVLATRQLALWVRQPRPAWMSWDTMRRRRVSLAAAAVVLVLAGSWVVREFRKEIHATHIWRAVHAGLVDRTAILKPDELVKEIEAIRALGGDGPGTVSMYGAWVMFGYQERLPSYVELTGQAIDAGRVKELMLAYYRRAMVEGPDNPHFYAYARYFNDPDWAKVYEEALRRFPQHPYRVMMSWALGAPYQALYDAAVREQLQADQSFRPGFRSRPELTLSDPAEATVDGLVATAKPGETILVEPFSTWGTDRLSVGLFLKILDGGLSGQLVDGAGERLGSLPAMSPADGIAYRAWHFDKLATPSRGGQARVALVAGPEGARFLIRDLYPVIENPRWFR